MRKEAIFFVIIICLIGEGVLSGCNSSKEEVTGITNNATILFTSLGLDITDISVEKQKYDEHIYYDLNLTSETFTDISDEGKIMLLDELRQMNITKNDQTVILLTTNPIVHSHGYHYSLDYKGSLQRDGEDFSSRATSTSYPTSIPKPTSTPFQMPNGDFTMSWNIYSSEYNSLGGILTIRKKGENYSQTIVYPDGSCGVTKLSLTGINSGELRLTDRPGNDFGDYMKIGVNGDLIFMDNQGFIYSVPLGGNIEESSTICGEPISDQDKEFIPTISVLSVTRLSNNKIQIILSTNLPDNMKLMANFTGPEEYWAQDSLSVKDGQIEMTFGNVSSGTFQLSINSIFGSLQPQDVQSIIGKDGENMTGNVIIFDSSVNSYFLEYTTNVVY